MSASRPWVMDSVHEAARIHDAGRVPANVGGAGNAPEDVPATTASTGERAVPYHCPYCAEEDLRPLGATPGAWHCRTCTRTFAVRYLGMASPTDPWPPEAPDAPEPIPTGGPR